MGCIDGFKFYVYRLKLPGEKEIASFSLEPEKFRDKGEEEIFPSVVKVEGSLERIDYEHWMLILNMSTHMGARCCVCDKKFLRFVELFDIHHPLHRDDVKSGIFDCRELIRQEFLLESDCFWECAETGCSEKEEVVRFLKKNKLKGTIPPGNL